MIHDSTATVRASDGPNAVEALEGYRPYLLMIAASDLDPALKAKCGASDVVQETLLEAHRGWPAFRGRSPAEVKGWLRGILANNLRDIGRRFRQEKRRAEREVPIGLSHAAAIADDEMTPSTRASRNEEVLALVAAMGRLPEADRRVIELRNHEGLPFADVGRILGKSPDAARMQWFRAVERLSRDMARIDGD
ncbi:sigma-70 family RNA polymerase sigma factor [Aquisphaera giovannonii]|nr:sigma-70 family RNA polymerase sigma factor [Aquisphaera giovannonii]